MINFIYLLLVFVFPYGSSGHRCPYYMDPCFTDDDCCIEDGVVCVNYNGEKICMVMPTFPTFPTFRPFPKFPTFRPFPTFPPGFPFDRDSSDYDYGYEYGMRKHPRHRSVKPHRRWQNK